MGKSCGNCANGTWTKGMDAIPAVCLKCAFAHGEPNNWKEKTMTNADSIRAMSDEELAKFMNLCGHDFPPYCDVESSISGECDQNCIKCAEKWLKQPAEEA